MVGGGLQMPGNSLRGKAASPENLLADSKMYYIEMYRYVYVCALSFQR